MVNNSVCTEYRSNSLTNINSSGEEPVRTLRLIRTGNSDALLPPHATEHSQQLMQQVHVKINSGCIAALFINAKLNYQKKFFAINSPTGCHRAVFLDSQMI